MDRPSWDEYFLNIAEEVSKRGTCLRRRFGAVIVKDNTIISTGYVGAPRGTPNCLGDLGYCYRNQQNILPGTHYEMCRSVHAENNASLNAGRERTSGATLFLYGENSDGSLLDNCEPCMMCWRIVINSGLEKVVSRTANGRKIFVVKERIKLLNENPNIEFIEGYFSQKK